MNLEKLTGEVLAIAYRAGEYLLDQRRKLTSSDIEQKGVGDFVSFADRHVEEMLTEALTALLPDSVVMAEEGAPEQTGDEWRWIVDPLDGTSNYLMGLPVWSISIALEDRRQRPERFGPVAIGVVHEPELRATYEAWRGGGARRNGSTIHVLSNPRLDRVLVATAFPFRRRELVDDYFTLFRRIYPRIADFRRLGSAAADLCWVADGTFGAYFELDLKPWDLAAGQLILEEAGGQITDWWGEDARETGWILAGTPEVYDAIRQDIDTLKFKRPEVKFK